LRSHKARPWSVLHAPHTAFLAGSWHPQEYLMRHSRHGWKWSLPTSSRFTLRTDRPFSSGT
jgi:hypothetical protein